MIIECPPGDSDRIYFIINEAAKAYECVIPADRYHQPYMSMSELEAEMERMTFFGWKEGANLVAVAGLEPIKDVTLIRHTYVLPDWQKQGIGGKLLDYLLPTVKTPRLLVGTWTDAYWAINFYRKHGFALLPDKDELLRNYWDIPQRQVETSVVLGMKLKNRMGTL